MKSIVPTLRGLKHFIVLASVITAAQSGGLAWAAELPGSECMLKQESCALFVEKRDTYDRAFNAKPEDQLPVSPMMRNIVLISTAKLMSDASAQCVEPTGIFSESLRMPTSDGTLVVHFSDPYSEASQCYVEQLAND